MVLPCYRAGRLAVESVCRLRADLADFGDELEVIVVDDGGGDVAAADVEAAGARLIALPHNLGKGAAVRAGMLASRGQTRVFTDVDVPYGTDPIRAAEYHVRVRGFHVAIGDRTLPESLYIEAQSPLRKLSSGLFTFLIGRVVTGGFFDTQCGLKGFRADVAEHLFRAATVDRFAFDVEVVYLALKYKLDVKRVPVRLERNDESSVRVWRDAPRMLYDVVRVIANQYGGRYRDCGLLELVARDDRSARDRYQGPGPAPRG